MMTNQPQSAASTVTIESVHSALDALGGLYDQRDIPNHVARIKEMIAALLSGVPQPVPVNEAPKPQPMGDEFHLLLGRIVALEEVVGHLLEREKQESSPAQAAQTSA